MKTLEQLIFHILRPQSYNALDPLQFAYQEKVDVGFAILYLPYQNCSHLDKGKGAVMIMFSDFSSISIPWPPLTDIQDMHLLTWITDYFIRRPRYNRLKDCSTEELHCSCTPLPVHLWLQAQLRVMPHAEVLWWHCHRRLYKGLTGGGVQEPDEGLCYSFVGVDIAAAAGWPTGLDREHRLSVQKGSKSSILSRRTVLF